jgi:hypothetical protein
MASSPTRGRFDVIKRHFSRCSSQKVGYSSKVEALDVAEIMMERGSVRQGCHITPYHCRECHEWHLYNRRIVFTASTS